MRFLHHARRWTPALCMCLVVALVGHGASANRSAALYGSSVIFDVYRDGKRVGIHRTGFQTAADGLRVNSLFELKIEFLFLTAYQYRYQSDTLWRGDRLTELVANVDDNGDKSAVTATTEGGGLRVSGAGGSYFIESPIFPTNHWHAGVLEQDRVLNTLTGKLNAVDIRPAGRETVPTENGKVPATRYVYSGDLNNEVWYDDAGRWVKMRFAGSDGSTIEYICKLCQGGKHDGD